MVYRDRKCGYSRNIRIPLPYPPGWKIPRGLMLQEVSPFSKEQARPQSSGTAMTSPGLPQPRVTQDNRVGSGPVLSFRQHKAGEVMAESLTAVWRNSPQLSRFCGNSALQSWGYRGNMFVHICDQSYVKLGRRAGVRDLTQSVFDQALADIELLLNGWQDASLLRVIAKSALFQTRPMLLQTLRNQSPPGAQGRE